LQELEPLLAAIGPAEFAKYQRLLELIGSDWAWRGQDPKDRVVIFTGRRETQRFLLEHLERDLKLSKGAVVGLDGAMADVDQTKVVEQFAQEKEAVRILVATEVASEGLNLHYLSHRLVHFDIPWSLMTLQQRNGRIDRYGQPQQPLIRYLLTQSRTEGMGDAEKILRVLIRKDDQAQKNIGDPSVFLRQKGELFDAEVEEDEIGKAFEAGDAEGLERRMDANAKPYLERSSELNLFEEMFGPGEEGSGPTAETAPVQVAVDCRKPFSLYPSLWTYVDRALAAVGEAMDRRGEKLDLRSFEDQERLEITPPTELQRRYERYPRELQPEKGQRLALSTDPAALQRALEQARRKDSARPDLEYLWDLHPLVDWLADRGQITFARHSAPVLQLGEGLEPGEVVMVLQGTIPNQKGMPVVQEWVAVRFMGSGLRVAAVEPFADVAERLQLGRKPYANAHAEIPESLKQQRRVAVEAANQYLLDCRERWTARMQPELESQRQRLRHLRGRQVEQLELNYATDQRPQQIKDRQRQERQKAIETRFHDHERFVSEVMTIEPAPYLKLVAVLHRDSS
jgi:hypothetical protein